MDIEYCTVPSKQLSGLLLRLKSVDFQGLEESPFNQTNMLDKRV